LSAFKRQQWILLADVHYFFRKLTDQKVGALEIGKEVMYAFNFNALNFVRAAHRRDILYTQPRHVTGSGAGSKSIGDVPFNILL